MRLAEYYLDPVSLKNARNTSLSGREETRPFPCWRSLCTDIYFVPPGAPASTGVLDFSAIDVYQPVRNDVLPPPDSPHAQTVIEPGPPTIMTTQDRDGVRITTDMDNQTTTIHFPWGAEIRTSQFHHISGSPFTGRQPSMNPKLAEIYQQIINDRKESIPALSFHDGGISVHPRSPTRDPLPTRRR